MGFSTGMGKQDNIYSKTCLFRTRKMENLSKLDISNYPKTRF